MGYEDSVYLAKLAEQAERYEGMSRHCALHHPQHTECWHRDG